MPTPDTGASPVIRFEHVTVTYPDAPAPVLRDVDLTIDEGELVLVVGRTGVGKSTLLGAINGLVPHFTGGHLAGRVLVDGRDTRTHPPRELADVVGVVGQDPLAGFVTDTVEEELAYGMEQLALPADVMRKRVEETLDLLGLAELRDRPLRALSGGQQQRVAIGSVLTAHPRVLVLDEPTSALDPTAAEEVLAAITRLVHDLGRRWSSPSTGSSASCSTPTASCTSAATVGVTDGAARADARARRRRATGRRARPPRGLVAAAALGARRAPAGAARCARRLRVRRAERTRSRPRFAREHCRTSRRAALSVRYGDVVAVRRSTSTCSPAKSSRAWAATARASRRCCGRSRARARARAAR